MKNFSVLMLVGKMYVFGYFNIFRAILPEGLYATNIQNNQKFSFVLLKPRRNIDDNFWLNQFYPPEERCGKDTFFGTKGYENLILSFR